MNLVLIPHLLDDILMHLQRQYNAYVHHKERATLMQNVCIGI